MYSTAIQNRKASRESYETLDPRNRNDVTYVMIPYDATKMDGAYSDGISSINPLFYQIFMNVQGFCIC